MHRRTDGYDLSRSFPDEIVVDELTTSVTKESEVGFSLNDDGILGFTI